jgi:hypothetical protein
MNHPQGKCPDPVQLVRLVGDPSRTVYRVCSECRASYEALGIRFVPLTTPEWVQRAEEHRLPSKAWAA